MVVVLALKVSSIGQKSVWRIKNPHFPSRESQRVGVGVLPYLTGRDKPLKRAFFYGKKYATGRATGCPFLTKIMRHRITFVNSLEFS